MKRNGMALVLAVVGGCWAVAQAGAQTVKDADASGKNGASLNVITPVFSQLVAFSYPRGFVPAFEDAKGGQYRQESVLQGESVGQWTQMITLTGAKGLASNPNMTPKMFAGNMADGFKRVCPESFAATGLGDMKIGAHDAFAAVVSCGVANNAADPHSESMLVVVVKGAKDYYTVQWAERAAASKTPIRLDDPKWKARLGRLSPIGLCPVVPGEKAPYPSCARQR